MARRTRPVRTLVAATAALTTVCCLSTAASGQRPLNQRARPRRPPERPRSAAAPAGTNLLANGDAEVGASSFRGYDEVIVPGWTVAEGLPTVVRYGVKALLLRSAPGPADRGNSYFAGGSGGNAELDQVVPLVAPDGGALPPGTSVTVDGWLGGLAASNDDPSVRLTFRGPGGAAPGDGEPRTGHAQDAQEHHRARAHVPYGRRPGGDLGRAGLARDDHAVHELRRLQREHPGQQPGLGGRPVADGVGTGAGAGAR